VCCSSDRLDDQARVTVAWGDSWHQKPPIIVLTGGATDRGVEVTADYGGGWRWMISLDGGRDGLLMTMHNVIPAEHATDEVSAGPYLVMVAEFALSD
jgi:hypothetical protein